MLVNRLTKYLCPISKTHIGRYHNRFSFVAFSQYLKNELSPLLRERNITQFINNEQSVSPHAQAGGYHLERDHGTPLSRQLFWPRHREALHHAIIRWVESRYCGLKEM